MNSIHRGVFAVNKAARSVLRRIGPDATSEEQRDQIVAKQVQEEQQT